MAEAILKDQELFNCPVCLDLLKNPATISCGHSFCMDCISSCWILDDTDTVYSCPQCRQTFNQRPVLNQNIVLAELVERLKNIQLQASADCYPGPGDVECDVCTTRKHKAIKSCLVCLVSYCETHLRLHNELNPGKKHKLIDTTGRLQEKICSRHDKLLEMFCRTDQQCICFMCTIDEHKGHDTVLATEEKTEKQRELEVKQMESQRRIQEKEDELQELGQAMESLKRSAQSAVRDSERIVTELIASIEREWSEVTEVIKAQEKAELIQAERLRMRLEQEIVQMKNKDAQLAQLLQTEDEIHFLQSFQSLCGLPESEDIHRVFVKPLPSFEEVGESAAKLKEQLQKLCQEGISKITGGPSGYYNQSQAYNSQYPLPTAANVTPTKAPVYGISRLPPQQPMYTHQPTHTPPLQTTPACIYPQDQVFGAPLRFESPATSLLSPYSEEYYSHSVAQPATNPTLPEPGYFTKPSAVTPAQPPKSGESKPMDFGKIPFGQQGPSEPPKAPSFGGGAVAQSTPTAAAFKFNSNFKSNDGDFTFSSANVKSNSESLLGLLTSDISLRTEGYSEQKPPAPEQPGSQPGIFTFGSKNAAGFSFTDAAQGKNLFAKTEPAFNFASTAKPVFGFGNAGDQEEKAAESDNDSTHVEEDEDGPHFEPIVPLPDKVDVKTGEEEEEEMFCNRAKLFRFDTETKEWKERGIGSIKILKHRTSGKVRLLMRREQVLKICANHYITADMVLKPNARSDKSWVWYAIDYADEMPKIEQLAIRFKTTDEAALFKAKFEEAQSFITKSPQKHEQREEKLPKPSTPEPAGKVLDLKAQFAKKDGEWDCNVCCVRNTPSAKQCVACQSPNPDAAPEPEGKPAEGFKGFPSVAPAGGFTFGSGEGSAKGSSSTSSSQGFAPFGSQIPASFKLGTTTPATTTAGFGSQFEKKPGQWDCSVCAVRNEETANSCVACQTPNPSAKTDDDQVALKPSTLSFGSGFGAQFSKKEGQWDYDICFHRNETSATECVLCQTPSDQAIIQSSAQGRFAAMFSEKEGQWDCDACLVTNESSSSHCVSCQTPNPNAKSTTTSAPSSSSFSFSFGSTANQSAATGFKTNFNASSTFQFGPSKDTASSAAFNFKAPATQAYNKSFTSSGFSRSPS